MAIPLLEGLSRPKRLIADKAYDAISLRRWLKRRGRIATRYARLARNYLASLALVSIVIAWT
jgi:transposase